MFDEGNWNILEPVMSVEVTGPIEFQGVMLSTLNKRHAVITDQDQTEGYCSIYCEVNVLSWATWSWGLIIVLDGSRLHELKILHTVFCLKGPFHRL